MEVVRTSTYLFAGLLFGAVAAVAGPTAAQTCQLERASVDAVGTEGDQGSSAPALTPDGRFLAFLSSATNLVPGDGNGVVDVFLRDLVLGTIERVSLGDAGGECDAACSYPAISDNGRYVVFGTSAATLVAGDTNAQLDVFLRDRWNGTTVRLSLGAGGVEGDGPSFGPTISPDARFVTFASWASNLVPGDTNATRDVFLLDRATGQLERVSVSTAGAEGDGMSGGGQLLSYVTADGRFVVFGSDATTLVPGDVNNAMDVFLRDRTAGTTVRLVLGQGGQPTNDATDVTSMTPDGRWIGLVSSATNLVAGDTNAVADAFVLDRTLGFVERVSVTTGGAESTGGAWGSVLSHAGRFAVFSSSASDLVPNDTNDKRDAFRRDRWAGTTERCVLSYQGVEPGNDIYALALSAAGDKLAFASNASGLVPSDLNDLPDVFVRTCTSATVFCAGDGSAAACPCGNAGAWNGGCANSTGAGASLFVEGVASVANDTLTLVVRGVPAGTSVLFFEGSGPLGGGQGTVFGDGLRCLGGTISRLGPRTAFGGTGAWGFGIPGCLPISIVSNVPGGGDFRWYQAWYRNAVAFCTAAPFNLSNGLEVLWYP